MTLNQRVYVHDASSSDGRTSRWPSVVKSARNTYLKDGVAFRSLCPSMGGEEWRSVTRRFRDDQPEDRDGLVRWQNVSANGEYRPVSAGYHFVCGVRTDDTLVCWGTLPYLEKYPIDVVRR